MELELQIIEAEKAYLSGKESILALAETEARKIILHNPEVECVVDCQGLSFVRLYNGRKIDLSHFPRLQSVLDLWYTYEQLEIGLSETRDNDIHARSIRTVLQQ